MSAEVSHIVVGVDGSDASLAASRWAGDLAARAGAQVTVVCAYSLASYSAPGLDGGFAVIDDQVLREAAQAAAAAAGEVAASRGAQVKVETELGDPSEVLVYRSRKADLVVIGTRHGGTFADRLLGAVSSAVPAHAKCPVAVIPVYEDARRFTPIKRIVVGVDGSRDASRALREAVDVAALWDCELTVVAAVPIAVAGAAMSWVPAVVDRRALIADINAALDESIAEAAAGRELRINRHALDGNAAALLTEFSTAVDLVVVGTRGRGGFAGLLLGSTSQTVLQHAACPVMTVPSRGRDGEPHPARRWTPR